MKENNLTDKFNKKVKTFRDKLSKLKKINVEKTYNIVKDDVLKKYKSLSDIKFPKDFNIKKIIEEAQDKIEQTVRKDSEEISLKQSTYWAKSISWLIIGGSAFGIGWLGIAQTEEIIITQGELEPIGGVIDIQIPLNGVTDQVLIEEGQKVSKGDVLMKLNNDVSQARMNAIKETLQINEVILEKLKILVEEGAVSKLQVLQQENKVVGLRSQKIENDVTMKYQVITSPVDGYVFDLKPTGPGYVARTSEPVLKIVPNNKLYAKIEIPSRSIGFVSTGKKVDISIDSFPASDFGVIEGTIEKIGSDALPPNSQLGKGYRFAADIKLKNQHLETANGRKLPLQVGMSLTGNIKLRKVSYLQILMNTFNEKTDSIRSL